MSSPTINEQSANGQSHVESIVRDRYSKAAQEQEPQLCCAVDYDPQYLKIIPQEIIDRDYGCGDPSAHVNEGETVLDLGSGGGKICYIAAQIVGSAGKVIGVDYNETMLDLARRHRQSIGDTLGYHNVDFRKGRIQDLQLNLELLEKYLQSRDVKNSQDWMDVEAEIERLRSESPLVENDSIDVVVSNCVLNLVDRSSRKQMFSEIYRVLKRGGRVAISDIVSDEESPEHLRADPHLWSGCISGAFQETAFLEAFEEAGFYGIEILKRQEEPWAVVEGIEYRSVTIQAFKGKDGPCLDRKQAVIYGGPWKAVIDDDGHKLFRGKPMAVCDKTYNIYTRAPYAEQIMPVPPQTNVPLEDATPYDCHRSDIRTPQETKRGVIPDTKLPDEDCCGSDGCC